MLDPALLAVWMVLWTAAILIAIWLLGSAALGGEPAAAIFLAIWVAVAGIGLVSAGRRIVETFRPGRTRRTDLPRNRRWDDGMEMSERDGPRPPREP
ncbi:MAG TPA: hypothetical protein VFN28_05350 [Amaricoccus sp.]|nr:hypothetical protein [Amaricoccus sp.]